MLNDFSSIEQASKEEIDFWKRKYLELEKKMKSNNSTIKTYDLSDKTRQVNDSLGESYLCSQEIEGIDSKDLVMVICKNTHKEKAIVNTKSNEFYSLNPIESQELRSIDLNDVSQLLNFVWNVSNGESY